MLNARKNSSEESGSRFAFGRNWRSFIRLLSPERIAAAEQSLQQRLQRERLDAVHFVDIGSGSGLFSLAARRLGATVVSFDYDRDSVLCTEALRATYFPGDEQWRISRGSVLDTNFLSELGTFDVVYSWGVLHHTGSMWQALENAGRMVKEGGCLFIAIYNDQGVQSVGWRAVKRVFCRMPRALQMIAALPIVLSYELLRIFVRALLGRADSTTRARGMDRWHDWLDWLGGYPFEVASPTAIKRFFDERGFDLEREWLVGSGWGCNEFVFARRSSHLGR